MEKIKVTVGVFLVKIPEIDLSILCGTPMDVLKHLMTKGLINEVEKNGVSFETGPNAILLSDISTQDGQFWNLSEFPVLHMLYKQGYGIPGHPGNKGLRPTLIGSEEQLKQQAQYIYRGNYGLASIEELMEAGYNKKTAKELWNLKSAFNYNSIKDTSALLNLIPLEDEKKEITDGVFIQRDGINLFTIKYNDETINIDMNLKPGEVYTSSYNLGFHRIKKEYFSVIHSGEGNGWDKDRPCMGSILTYQGKIYLVDAHPNIQTTLLSLGICVSEIEGIFHTHAHDDHFAGLTHLLMKDRKIKYFATQAVCNSVKKKMAALLGRDEAFFGKIFDVHILEEDNWNNIEGLEVRPIFSPHPVETTPFYFRVQWGSDYKSYYHLADTTPKKILNSYFSKKTKDGKPLLSQELYDKIKKDYKLQADIKKIDVGGGLIHAISSDFENDKSPRIILSHLTGGPSVHDKEIGSSATFGMQDVLIPTKKNYNRDVARNVLQTFFPGIERWDLRMLLNYDIEEIPPETILQRKNEYTRHVLVVVSGFAEYVRADKGITSYLTAGSLIGEISSITGQKAKGTYRTCCYCRILKIPVEAYLAITEKYKLKEEILRYEEVKRHLRISGYFGTRLSSKVQEHIAINSKLLKVKKGDVFSNSEKEGPLYMLMEGAGQLFAGDQKTCSISKGECFCIENVLSLIKRKKNIFRVEIEKASTLLVIPCEYVKEIPIIQMMLLETYEKRIKKITRKK